MGALLYVSSLWPIGSRGGRVEWLQAMGSGTRQGPGQQIPGSCSTEPLIQGICVPVHPFTPSIACS